MMENENLKTHIEDQINAGVVGIINNERFSVLSHELSKIIEKEASQITRQNNAFIDALNEINQIREKLKIPEHILGRPDTKHGEIAEMVEVGIRNARNLINQEERTAKLLDKGIERFSSVDYIIDGINVQSKFINGINNNLEHILNHLNDYPGFPDDGAYYHIPKDHYEAIQDLLKNINRNNFSDRTIRAITEKIKMIENATGRKFEDAVHPAISDYREVQIGTIDKTLNKHENDISNTNSENLKKIKTEAKDDKVHAELTYSPSFKEAAKLGAIGVMIGGGLEAGFGVYKKYKEGKNISNYTVEDWSDIGIDFTKGGVKGGVSATAIYGLTNCSKMPAPIAGAFVSTCFGVGKLTKSFFDGDINEDEYVEQGTILCFDAGAVTLSAIIGQTIIPIPIIGALIGTLAAKTFSNIVKNRLSEKSKEIEKLINEKYEKALIFLDRAFQKTVNEILEEYEKLGSIVKMAFDPYQNSTFHFKKSIELAELNGVENSKILTSIDSVDNFMLA